MFFKEITTKNTEPTKVDPILSASKKSLRKTARITATPNTTTVKEERKTKYNSSNPHITDQLTPSSVSYIWNEIMSKIKEPTELAFFQQHIPTLTSSCDLQLEVLSKDNDVAQSLCDRIERYYTTRTKISTKVLIKEKEGSEEEQENQATLNEMMQKNESIKQLIKTFQLHFE
ncbi:hypothetical protein OAT16_04790 [Prolixibacteraceae bacterium]|nr:hypothetical protein [Prolixibacteraceae bacterium]